MPKKNEFLINLCLFSVVLVGCRQTIPTPPVLPTTSTPSPSTSTVPIIPTPTIDEDIIRGLFAEESNESGSNYEIGELKWHKGSFTKKGQHEAIISFYDSNQGHAAGYSEIWLLRFENKWEKIKKIEDCDSVSFKVLDIEKDGKLEIWITSHGGNQGRFLSEGKLVSLDLDSESILYSNSGFDYCGAEVEGESLCEHKVEFKDVDKDGILEILDLEERTTFGFTNGKKESDSDDSEYIPISSTSKKSIYKLKNGKFEEWQRAEDRCPPLAGD